MTQCSVVGCDKTPIARGWCHMHYKRWQKYGTPGHAAKHKPAHLILREWVEDRDRTTGCWDDVPWVARTVENGYPALVISGRYRVASNVVLEYDGRPRPPGKEALHSCDDQECVNPAHLRWGTRSENVREAYARGQNPIGQENPLCTEPGCDLRHKSHYMYEYMRARRAGGIR